MRLNLAVQLFASGDVAGAETQLNEALRLPLQLPNLRAEHIKVLRRKISGFSSLYFHSRFHFFTICFRIVSTTAAFCFQCSRAARLKIVERETAC